MKNRIGEIALMICLAGGLAACSGGKEPPPELRNAGQSSGGTADGAPGSASADGTAGTTASGTSGPDSLGGANGATAANGTTAANTGATGVTANDEPPADPNAPIVRVYQVDGTDSIEVSVDARHMPSNLIFEDSRCKVLFAVGPDTNRRSEAKDFVLGRLFASKTPEERIFRHRLGANAEATSYSFAATQTIAGTMQMRKSVSNKSAMVLRRAPGVNIRAQLLPIKPTFSTTPGRTATLPATTSSITTSTSATATKVTVTRVPVTLDSTKRRTTIGTQIAPRTVPERTLRPRVR